MIGSFESDLEESSAKKAWLITFCDLISLLLTFFILIYTQVFTNKSKNIEATPPTEEQSLSPSTIQSYFLPVGNNFINLNLLSKILNYKLSLLATINYIDIVFDNKQINIFIDLEQICENEINKRVFFESLLAFFVSNVSIAIHIQDNIIDFDRAKKLQSMLKEYTNNINIILNRASHIKTSLQGSSIGIISLESN